MDDQLWVGPRAPHPAHMRPASNGPSWLPSSKGGGGLWTSTYLDAQEGSAWVQWCRAYKHPAPHPWWRLAVDPHARIYTVSDDATLMALLALGAFTPPHIPYGFPFDMRRPDYPVLARSYDGIHLDASYARRASLGFPGLRGWDCESTFWLRWAFTAVAPVG